MPALPRLTPRIAHAWGPRSAFALMAALLLAVLLVLPALGVLGQSAPVRGRVTGTIEGAPEGTSLAGVRVVLVQIRIDEAGRPQGQPVQNQIVGADGTYAFAGVPIAPRTVYQLGADVEGQVVGSQPFTFPAGEQEVLLNLHFPRIVSDASAVRIDEVLIAVEPHRGAVWITEVLHLVNPGTDAVEGVQRPLELAIPDGAVELEVLREIQTENGHERLGGKLLVYGNLEPGRSTVAVRYRLPVWLGAVRLTQQYPHMVGKLNVLVPEGSLRLQSPRFSPAPMQTFDKSRFDVWSATDLPALESIPVHLTGVPVRQEVYLLPAGGFIVLMLGVVIWFLRRRLPQALPQVSA